MATPVSSRAEALPDLSRLPGLQQFLATLPPAERSVTDAQLAQMKPADVVSLGASEAQPHEYDYWIDQIDGIIPEGLNGTLYRNGPGRWQDHTGRPLRHLFDGDGMLSAFRISEGKIHYRNRYVRTRHYLGKSGIRHLGTNAPGGWLANIGRTPPNLANTNVVKHAGHVYALWEGGPPYEIHPETLETMGPRRFGGRLRWMGSYSAHPSFCPRTGEMFNFGVDFGLGPELRIYRTDRSGKLTHFRSARLPYVAMVHDFTMTERYLVFLVSPIIIDALPMVLGLKPIGDAMTYQPKRGSYFILVPRDGGKIRRVEHDPILQFHISNAYDDQGDVVVDAITYEDPALLDRIAQFRTSALRDSPSWFTRFRVTSTGRVTREALSDTTSEFPRHNFSHEGRPYRYAYVNSRHRLASLYDSITKIDLQSGAETCFAAEEPGNSYCEPVFTPKPDPQSEDDGWLLTVEYQAAQNLSRLVIFDAMDLAAGPVATAQLTHHLPQGFHGNFAPAR